MLRVKEYPLSEEYKKDTGITPEDVRMFREWLTTQPHLPNEHITDLNLILTYHACLRSLSLSKSVLDSHLTMKTHLEHFFRNRHLIDRLERFFNFGCVSRLPNQRDKGYACFICRLKSPDLSLYSFSDFVWVLFMLIDLYQYKEGTWPGIIFIIDMDTTSFGHLAKSSVIHIQQLINFLQESLLIRLEQICFINAAPFIDKLLFIIKSFVNKFVWERISVHQVGANTLNKYYSIDDLPVESGGKYKTMEELNDLTLSMLKANNDYFVDESRKLVNESLRPDKSKTHINTYGGVEGSFKKLDID